MDEGRLGIRSGATQADVVCAMPLKKTEAQAEVIRANLACGGGRRERREQDIADMSTMAGSISMEK